MIAWLATIPPLAVLLVVAFFVAVESIGIPLPGETVLIAATLLSIDGHVSPWFVATSAVIGAVLGDSIGYLIGRRFGVRLLTVGARRFPKQFGAEQIHRAIGGMNRWGAWAVVGGRFVAFLRILVGPLAGTLRMPYRRFLAANATGAVLWAGAVTTIVYSLGRAAVAIIHQFSWIALVAVAVAIVVVAITVVYRRNTAAAAAAGSSATAVGAAGSADGSTPDSDTTPAPLEMADLFEPDGSLSPLASAAGMHSGEKPLRGIRSAVTTVFAPLARAARRTPFTAGLLGAFVVVALATGALWSPIARRSWYHDVAYGVPSFLDGHWYTLITGTFLSQVPIQYALILIGIVVAVGWAEVKFGTLRAFGIFAGGQIAAVSGTLFVLLAARSFDSAWAADLASHYDVGPSGGVLACLAAALITVRAPWRLRLRFALLAYVTVSLIYLGTLADLEHFLGVAVVMLVAPFVLDRAHPAGRPSAREWRILAFASLVILAAVEVIGTLFPTDDSLRATTSDTSVWIDVAVDVIIIAFIANGIRLGHRLPWVLGVILGALNVLEFVGLAIYAIVALDFPADLFTAMANSALWIALLVIFLLGHRAYRVPLRRSRRVVRNATAAASPLEILTTDGGGTLSWMTMWPANSYFITADGESFVAYQRHSGVAIALGDPVGPPEKLAQTIVEFVAECERIGLAPCLFSVSDTVLDAAPTDWANLQVAEDTIIDLPTLEMTGKKWQGIRSALNRAERENISFRMTALADEPWAVVSQVRAISEEWVGDKALPEMGFTLGGVDEALDPHVKTALALDESGTVHGVLSWLPVYGVDGTIRGWTLDLMRRRDDGFKLVMEFLIASSCLAFQAEGALFVSLSGAPLAHGADYQPTGIDAVLDSLGTALEPLYGFQSLHNFKTKFNPRYERMSLLFRDEGDLPKIALALTRAFLPGESLLGIARMGLGR
ncbi:phosphatidylglycerol lysyltransferase domain-containing protein [Subtercola sp. RTI3]|uniref:phosphatidylglycerol lysyltransferase domain-containing protein n=1 Tax=Subtercola sp. RTI3 TaxID=3048639 RepID=UPI002B2397AA|nr:phosphatidylglycerol lysyltransferase domain-containing protein [Subtercola sp. RTI3]MEA9986523.1 phosphatidylglycerol lysyltransferase domain-containing protein [Subtercola sp. RTI3]